MLDSMNPADTSRQLRFFVLRCSSPQWATILISAIAAVLAGYWLAPADYAWLVFLSGLLAAATLCVLLRTAPVMWRDLTRYRLLQHASRLQCMHNHVAWRFDQPPHKLAALGQDVLAEQGYRCRQEQHADLTRISAMKGGLNRLGFILVHGAGLLILMGAVLDSDLWLHYQTGSGKLKTETRRLPLNEMTGQSTISARSGVAFQGRAPLRPGQITDEVRVVTSCGELSKHLPFAVIVKSVELDANYPLQENNFLTRIAILDPHLDKPVMAVLGTNRPFHYRGLDYYQQAVTDGGSEVTVAMWPVAHVRPVPLTLRTRIGAERQLQTRQGTISIVFDGLNPRNVIATRTARGGPSQYQNIGPSLFYRVNDEDAREREFVNYMLPVLQEGRYFFISGIRHSHAEPFQFLHIPVDRQGGVGRFFNLHATLFDNKRIDAAISRVLADAASNATASEREALTVTLKELLILFRKGGYQAINEAVAQRVDKARYQQSLELSYKLMRSVLYALYTQAGQTGQPADERDVLFFEDALSALSGLAEAAMPFYIQQQDMTYKPVVNLLVSYKPGETLFFTGWFMLLFGLLAGLYSYHRRIWLLLRVEDGSTAVTVAGMGGRQGQRFAREFSGLSARLHTALKSC